MFLSKDKSKAKPNGAKVGECTKCNAPIGDKHLNTWCIECGEPLPTEVKKLIPAIALSELSAEQSELSAEQKNLRSKKPNFKFQE